MIIFDKKYSGESLIDLDGDVYDIFEYDAPDIPRDEHGFQRGMFRVTIEWIDE